MLSAPENNDSFILKAVFLAFDRFDLYANYGCVTQIGLRIFEMLGCKPADNSVENLHLLCLFLDEIRFPKSNHRAVFGFEIAGLVAFDHTVVDRHLEADLGVTLQNLYFCSCACRMKVDRNPVIRVENWNEERNIPVREGEMHDFG